MKSFSFKLLLFLFFVSGSTEAGNKNNNDMLINKNLKLEIIKNKSLKKYNFLMEIRDDDTSGLKMGKNNFLGPYNFQDIIVNNCVDTLFYISLDKMSTNKVDNSLKEVSPIKKEEKEVSDESDEMNSFDNMWQEIIGVAWFGGYSKEKNGEITAHKKKQKI